MNLLGNSENAKRQQLYEVVLSATPDELRIISEFLSVTADRMDSMGSDYDCDHLSDHAKKYEGRPHLIVVRGNQEGTY
ncbi:MAG: hypothetical protein AAF385_05435 [Pseudomonadota bacterium]